MRRSRAGSTGYRQEEESYAHHVALTWSSRGTSCHGWTKRSNLKHLLGLGCNSSTYWLGVYQDVSVSHFPAFGRIGVSILSEGNEKISFTGRIKLKAGSGRPAISNIKTQPGKYTRAASTS